MIAMLQGKENQLMFVKANRTSNANNRNICTTWKNITWNDINTSRNTKKSIVKWTTAVESLGLVSPGGGNWWCHHIFLENNSETSSLSAKWWPFI